MKLKEIHRTSTFAWSPSASLPLLATGTVAGALDESFSNESQLEIWAPDFLDRNEFDLGVPGQNGPKGVVRDTSRFNRITWGAADKSRPQGIIAAGMENGELALWDPSAILSGSSVSDALILRNTTHTGPVRALDFNNIATNLLASGAVAGEVCVWDLKDPSKFHSPGPRNGKLDEVTSVAWNQQVQYILAGASSTGYTIVWDLRKKAEVCTLAYGGGVGTLAGHGAGNGLAYGGRRGMSAVAWQPDVATRLVTASEDDSSPIIMVWDLRNARAPEKILTGHEKGILSLSWCGQDADMLLSCGKDNRALCWNPQTSEIIGELPSADNWAFQVEWCPRNPDLLATSFFNGTIGIHSIQSTNEAATQAQAAPIANGADLFDAPSLTRSSQGTISLKQPPKWLRRPVSASFGFGGKLVSVSNLLSEHGKLQSSVVHIRHVALEEEFVSRATKLIEAAKGGEETLKSLADQNGWKALLSLFQADSRDELVTLLGFSKEEIASRIAEAVEKLKVAAPVKSPLHEQDITDEKPHEPVVSFLEPEREEVITSDQEAPGSAGLEKTPSEISAGATSDATSGAALLDGESTTTVPSLFGDDEPGTPQRDGNGADFFATVALGQSSGTTDTVVVPHTNYGIDSSVAATIGSRPSSAASEVLKNNIFRIYPAGESENERLVTKALVLGDFDSAVQLCLSSGKYADAILLAVKGGPELLARTQAAYFETHTTSSPYLRLFQSIVQNDLTDIVQNADLQEWQEIFVVLCTFASKEEFPGLVEQLGRRLEFQFTVSRSSSDPEAAAKSAEYRQNATLTYLAAARLERLVSIWTEEMLEEEKQILQDDSKANETRFSAHAQALQTFMEKIAVFRAATKYADSDLAEISSPDAEPYKLATLYDRYFEYADLLASQGLLKEAASYLKLTPPKYEGPPGSDLSVKRQRLLNASTPVASTSSGAGAQAAVPASTSHSGYRPYAPAHAPVAPTASISTGPSVYTPYNAPTSNVPAATPYAPAQVPQQPYPQFVPQPPAQIAGPPPRGSGGPPPPPRREENGGWNDAPMVKVRSPAANQPPAKVAHITSPFPNSVPSPSVTSPGPYTQQQAAIPPPPRPGSVTGRPPPPHGPPRGPGGGMYAPPRPPSTTGGMFAPPRPPSTAAAMPPPPPRLTSPPQQHAPGPHGPPPGRGPVPGQTPPPGQFARSPPVGVAVFPPGPGGAAVPPPPGPYARPTPPPGQQQPYGAQVSPPQPHHQAPPQNSGPYAPPPGAQPRGPPQPPSGMGGPAPPPPRGPPGPSGTSAPPPAAAKVQKGPPEPKYPVGDRSHIPDYARPAFEIISGELMRLRSTIPPSQKRLVDDLERRINPLFDALNCETLSKPVVEQLVVLTRAIQAHDRAAALALHIELLTTGSQTDDIGLWMSGIKQLIQRL